MKISIIIPIYNEDSTIENLLKTLEPLKGRCEILFVDGGSSDGTLQKIGETYRVLTAPKGRASQMNHGALHSTGDVLFFLHCDSEVPATALEEIEKVMQHYKAGCFGIAFHSKHFFMWTCKVISNHRAKVRQIMFGDQGIFIDKDLFFEIGMFPDMPIMEDYQLSMTLQVKGIRMGMTKSRIYTSHRRFQGNTVRKLSVMWEMYRLRVMYRRGVPIEKIARLYEDVR